jgi:hypothetical protein
MNFHVALGQGAINSTRGNWVKGGVEPGPEWAGPVGPGRPAQDRFGPGFLPGCFSHDSLFVCTCMWAFDVVSFTVKA